MAFVAAAPLVPLLLGGAGAGLSAYSAIQGGNAKSSQLNYQAAVAKNNAIISEQNAESAIEAGGAKAATTSMKGAAVGGSIKAKQAASGVDVNTGSNVDIQEGQREAALLDTEIVLHNADLQAYGYRSQAKNFEAEAGLAEAGADQAKTAGYLQAGAGILGSASSLGYKWGGMQSDTAGQPLSLHAEDYQ